MHPFAKGYFKGFGLTTLTFSPLIGTILWFQGAHSAPYYFIPLTLLGAVATYLAYRK